MSRLIFTLLCLFPFISNAQGWQWANIAGGPSGSERISDHASDLEGNVFAVGNSPDTVFIESDTFLNQGLQDIFLIKYAADGTYDWAKYIGTPAGDANGGVGADGLGNCYLAGDIPEDLILDSIHTVEKGMFLIKYSPDGDVLWGISDSSTGFVSIANSVTDNDGNTYVSFHFNGDLHFDSDTLFNVGLNDLGIVKYNSEGEFVWAEAISGTMSPEGKDLTLDPDGKTVCLLGRFEGSVMIGDTAFTSAHDIDGFLTKMDSSGTFLWSNHFSSGTSSPLMNGISVSEDHKIFMSANMLPGTDVSGISAPGPGVAHLAAFKADGATIFVSPIADGDDVAVGNNGLVHVTGALGSPGFYTYDTTGVYVDDAFATGSVAGSFLNITVDAKGDVVLSSVIGNNNAMFDTVSVINTTMSLDFLIAKYNLCPSANFTVPALICLGDTLLLENQSTGGTTWEWFVDGMSVSTDTNLMYAFPSTGIATVQLIADEPGCSDTLTQMVSVSNAPLISLGADTIICEGVFLTTSPGSGFATYEWSNGALTEILAISTSGTYCVTVSDMGGCEATDCITVDVLGSPDNAITIDTTFCPMIDFSIVNTGDTATGWSWDFGDGIGTSSMANPSYTYGGNGMYPATLIASNSCEDDTVSLLVEINCLTHIENLNELQVGIFPNPTQNSLNIDLSSTSNEELSIQIIGVSGEKLMEKTVKGGSAHTLELATFPGGIYSILVSEKGMVYAQTFLLLK